MTSLRRLRALAGLTESIADDPYTNREIEKRLAAFPVDQHALMLDALEALKNAPGPLMPNAWARAVQPLHPDTAPEVVRSVLATVAREFTNVVRRAKGGHEWVRSDDMTGDPDVSPMMRSAIEGQVGMTYTALEIARSMPSFTVDSLAAALSQRLGLPGMTAGAFAHHFIDQFRSYMQPIGADAYRMAEENPQTTDDSMALLRSLAARKDV